MANKKRVVTSGKVNINMWANLKNGELYSIHNDRFSARSWARGANWNGKVVTVVRISGTVTYTLAK